MGLWTFMSWFATGYRHFGKAGFERASKKWSEEIAAPLPASLKKRVVVITGANSGLGYVTAKELYNHDCDVHMLCRNEERGKAALEGIRDTGKDNTNAGKLTLHLVDVSDHASVEKFLSSVDFAVDCLVNNAGVLLNERKTHDYGECVIEQSIETNVVGLYQLTQGLLPWLKKGKNPMVVNVISGGMLLQPLRVTLNPFAKHKFDGSDVYAVGKRQVMELTHYWAELETQSSVFAKEKVQDDEKVGESTVDSTVNNTEHVLFVAMDPGWADTPGLTNAIPSFSSSMKKSLRTMEQGADTIVWLASRTGTFPYENGCLLRDRVEASEHLWGAGTKKSAEETQAKRSALVAELEKANALRGAK